MFARRPEKHVTSPRPCRDKPTFAKCCGGLSICENSWLCLQVPQRRSRTGCLGHERRPFPRAARTSLLWCWSREIVHGTLCHVSAKPIEMFISRSADQSDQRRPTPFYLSAVYRLPGSQSTTTSKVF